MRKLLLLSLALLATACGLCAMEREFESESEFEYAYDLQPGTVITIKNETGQVINILDGEGDTTLKPEKGIVRGPGVDSYVATIKIGGKEYKLNVYNSGSIELGDQQYFTAIQADITQSLMATGDAPPSETSSDYIVKAQSEDNTNDLKNLYGIAEAGVVVGYHVIVTLRRKDLSRSLISIESDVWDISKEYSR